jgi:hypothetical protein
MPFRKAYVPLSIWHESRVVTWLWRSPGSNRWLSYTTAQRLARWLP